MESKKISKEQLELIIEETWIFDENLLSDFYSKFNVNEFEELNESKFEDCMNYIKKVNDNIKLEEQEAYGSYTRECPHELWEEERYEGNRKNNGNNI